MWNALKKHKASAVMLFVCLLIHVYPSIVVWLNPIPDLSQLVRFRAQILNADVDNLGVTIRNPGGKIEKIYFPTSLYTIATGPTKFNGLSFEQEKMLKGCLADIYGKKVEWLVPSRFFVWKIHCEDVDVSFEQIVRSYEINVRFGARAAMVVSLIFIGMIVGVFVKERRKL